MKKLALILLLSLTVLPALGEDTSPQILKICKKSKDYNKCKLQFNDAISRKVNKPVKIKIRPYKKN